MSDPINDINNDDSFSLPSADFGWIKDPEAVEAVVSTLPYKDFSETPAAAFSLEELPEKACLWDFAIQVTGAHLPPKNQGSVGSCVSFGCATAIEYTLCAEIANGSPEEFQSLVEEIIYGGSRVEIGKGRLGRGDGSIGAWAAKFVNEYGILNRGVFLDGKYDFTKYSESKCRQYGANGVPDELEPIVKKFPVKSYVPVKNWVSFKKAIAQGYGVSIASNQGFSMKRNEYGICDPRGSWAHQMAGIAFCKINGDEYGFIENSWGLYLGKDNLGPNNPPPQGFYAHWKTIEYMLKQGDSFAYSSITGFPLRKLRWKI